MKAIVQRAYGSIDSLELQDIAKPVIGGDEVLVRVHATSVHPDVWHSVTGLPHIMRLMGSGLRAPKNPVPGIDLAGRVEATGANVTEFECGDDVYGVTVGVNLWRNGGTFAEYACVAADRLSRMPSNLTFEEAAAVTTPALVAYQNLFAQNIEAGQRVLVNGAAGGVGMFAVQLAKARGADVTGVDHTDKLPALRSIGVDEVIDYTTDDFTRSNDRYDIVLDIPGNRNFAAIRDVLTPDGIYILVGHDNFGRGSNHWLGSVPRFVGLLLRSPFTAHIRRPAQPGAKESFDALTKLIEAGHVKPVIDSTYPLSGASEALRHLMNGNPAGRIVLTV